jgi:hypothetical protein
VIEWKKNAIEAKINAKKGIVEIVGGKSISKTYHLIEYLYSSNFSGSLNS